MKYNPEIHKRKSTRLKEYDYSQPGYYFVTICNKDRMPWFGEIENGKMIKNEIGEIVAYWIKQISNHYQNIEIDYYCIMPNHVHLIIVIHEIRRGGVTPPLQMPKLGNIIAYFKYKSTKQINIIRNSPGIPVWQRNYYEHIIRNDKELYESRKYIENNPLNWRDDEYND